MSEQREALAEALWRHKMARPDGASVTWCACLGWSATRGDLDSDERAYNAHVADTLARLLADERQKGRDEHAAAVKAVLPDECWVTRSSLRCTALIGGTFPNGREWVEEMCCVPCRLRAALTTGVAEEIR